MNQQHNGETAIETLALRHYENFPVASHFIPKRYRRPIHLIYAFARTGDDIADEWPNPMPERLHALDDWSARLMAAVEKDEGTRFFRDLATVIHTYRLDHKLFDDLIDAFRMDVRHTGFRTYADLLTYCRCSANPVGRLMLQIFDCETTHHCELSDAFCTALQLANFWQDLFIDIGRGRFYIPEEDCVRFGITRNDLKQGKSSERIRSLVRFEVDRTKALFMIAEPLPGLVSSHLRFELKLIWHGGMRILEKIERSDYDTLSHRPALGMFDKILSAFRAWMAG
jgi:squalene synthase HpnC